MAHIIVTGSTRNVLLESFKILAIQIAPNATWLSPSPMNEYLFKTSVTPSSEEHREINTPTIKAYITNE